MLIVSDPLRNAPTAKMPTAEENDVLVPYPFFLLFLLAVEAKSLPKVTI
jgi:hypothetical protein